MYLEKRFFFFLFFGEKKKKMHKVFKYLYKKAFSRRMYSSVYKIARSHGGGRIKKGFFHLISLYIAVISFIKVFKSL